jgi:uncharacterized protein involved in exopolysaccharide biosynthesis
LQLDSTQILRVLWRRKLSGALGFIVVVAGAAAAFLLATPRYDASALISIGDVPSRSDTPRDKAIEEELLSIAVVADTDDVLRVAANRVGFDKLFSHLEERLRKSQAGLRALPGGETRTGPETDILLPDLRRALSVKPEAKTSLITISFSGPDPTVAADFANAVADATINREIDLSSHPGAVDFYEGQRTRFEADIGTAASALAKFVSSKSIYSIQLQQELLLRRASDLQAAIGSTMGLIAERASQKKALVQQLAQIKPVADSPLESNFLRLFGGAGPQGTGDHPNASGDGDKANSASETLPLSLERVYREGFATLVSLNSELSGLQSRQSREISELNEINTKLSDLSANAAEFNRLEKAVTLATNNADIFDRRTVDETIDRDLAKARMSSLRIVQEAAVPFKPAYPSLRSAVSAGFIGGLLAALAAALFTELVASMIVNPNRRARASASEMGVERRDIVKVGVESS